MNLKLKNTYFKELPGFFYTATRPTPVKNPKVILFNGELAQNIGLGDFEASHDLAVLSGNNSPANSEIISQAYSGHQFGHFTRLGDGRAHLLGEILTKDKKLFDIQLKGSGRTPYSRGGDGRAPLGPMLREYIMSEALHHLNIPTTRSLSVVETGEPVFREDPEPGAVLTRIAKSHIRVGTFEHAAAFGETDHLKELAGYTLNRHYPDSKNHLEFFLSVCKNQAKLISQWMSFGFIHGVMNTDNMSIAGETIDYGPCAFLDEYNPLKKFSYIDRDGRYAFARQPAIGLWNLSRFAESLLPLLDENKNKAMEIAKEGLSEASNYFREEWLAVMKKKLGLEHNNDQESLEIINSLLELMEKYKADFTNTFRALSEEKILDEDLFKSDEFKMWSQKWKATLKTEDPFEVMKSHNPSLIARNHQVEGCIYEVLNKSSTEKLHRLINALKTPFTSEESYADLRLPPKDDEKVKNTFCGT